MNFFGALNINGDSKIYPIKHLTKESFAQVLIKLRKDFSDDNENIKMLNDILDKVNL